MFLFVLLFLWQIAAYGSDITLESNTMFGKLTENFITFSGSVKIVSNDFTFEADKAVVKLEQPLNKNHNKISQVALFGKPVRGNYKENTTFCSNILIDMDKKIIIFEKATIINRDYQLEADKVSYDFKSDQVEISAAKNNSVKLHNDFQNH
jgi:lipopolysaccharide transport protein LptA